MFYIVLYAPNTRLMLATDSTDTTSSGSRPAAHTSDVEAGKMKDEDISEASFAPARDYLRGEKFSAIYFDPKEYSGQKIKHPIF